MADNSVDAIVTDPPYFKVKGEAWDHQWDKPHQFIEWIGQLAEQWQRVLRPNGSLYVFASPKMAARVEVKLMERFNILPTIVWMKRDAAGNGISNRSEITRLRSFFPQSERIIFAEHYGADNIAKGEAGYENECQQLHRRIFQIGPLCERLGVSRSTIAELILLDYKNIESAKAQASNWILGKNIPNKTDFERLRTLLPIVGEYEDLRREYEDLRRPFTVTSEDQYTDVWTFHTVQAYNGKHVCEKPLAMMEHIINASTRPGAVVLDCFSGSAATGHACVNLGRDFIGIELCERWAATGRRRLDLASSGVKSRRIGAIVPDAAEVKRQLGLFA